MEGGGWVWHSDPSMPAREELLVPQVALHGSLVPRVRRGMLTLPREAWESRSRRAPLEGWPGLALLY